MPEQEVALSLRRARRTLLLSAVADAGLAAAGTIGVASVLGAPAAAIIPLALATFATAVLLSWRRWTDARTARAIEARNPSLQNLLVTAQEALAGRPLHPVIAHELLRQAADRVRHTTPLRSGRALGARFALATVALLGALAVADRSSPVADPGRSAGSAEPGAARETAPDRLLRVIVTPPQYARRPVATLVNPTRVDALEGSRVRLELPGNASHSELVAPGAEPQPFTIVGPSAVFDFVASTSRVYVVRRRDAGQATRDHLLQLQVHPDERPVVTIERPGRDLLFGSPSGTVPITITASDDINVASVSLRYTRITGSGETFTFEEGELPLDVTPSGPASRRAASGTLQLDRIELEDGDTLVYRALARDDKPGGDPVSSETFLVEIGKRGEASSTGFSVPEERDRQGLSQQMLIIKTEKLHAGRAQLSEDALLEQSRLLAIEQRMVRAEFVFMTGGEVVDEVEEAEHSHELATGRFENSAQVELLNAVREMSRAEARLNAADTQQALVYERAALRALERAFDRRRYFLRTLPERTRIDPARRLTGDLATARPEAPDGSSAPDDPMSDELRATIGKLSAAIEGRAAFDAALAARVVALDPDAPVLQMSALHIASGASRDETLNAAREARARLTTMLERRLVASPSRQLRRDPLAGYVPREVRR